MKVYGYSGAKETALLRVQCSPDPISLYVHAVRLQPCLVYAINPTGNAMGLSPRAASRATLSAECSTVHTTLQEKRGFSCFSLRARYPDGPTRARVFLPGLDFLSCPPSSHHLTPPLISPPHLPHPYGMCSSVQECPQLLHNRARQACRTCQEKPWPQWMHSTYSQPLVPL
jgi:hypothetical protein